MDGSAGARRLVVASRNAGKVAEIRALLAGCGMEVIGIADLDGMPELDEPYDTFEANAHSKALEVARHTGVAALADDSGLQVDALDGRPGVHSSRYGDSDRQRIERLLAELTGVPDERRSARFVCVIVAAYQDGILGCWEGRCEGYIAHEPHGTAGFGYDPIFIYPPFGCTFAEVSTEEKNAVSHRGRALQAMIADLPDLLAHLD